MGHDIDPEYRADIVIMPPLRSMLLISYWGRPKTISESVKRILPRMFYHLGIQGLPPFLIKILSFSPFFRLAYGVRKRDDDETSDRSQHACTANRFRKVSSSARDGATQFTRIAVGAVISGTVSMAGAWTTALFFTGWKPGGDNLAEVLKPRTPEVPAPIQIAGSSLLCPTLRAPKATPQRDPRK